MSTSISDLYGMNNSLTVNAVYEKNGSNSDMGVEDFLQLMIAEMKNMDFTSSESTDSTVYVTQLAQIASMQQMEQLAYYSKTSYVMNLVGKEVTVASLSLGGNVNSDTGVVEKISLSGDDFEVYVNGKAYSLSNIMSVNNPDATTEEEMSKAANMTPYLLKRGSDSATIAWNAPECSDLSKYYFDVYYSEDSAFDTISQVKNGTLVGSFKGTDDLYVKLDDLSPETRYYVNIIMNSTDGKQEIYQKLIFDTKEGSTTVSGSTGSGSVNDDTVEETPDISAGENDGNTENGSTGESEAVGDGEAESTETDSGETDSTEAESDSETTA